MHDVNELLLGAIACSSFTVALFFWRFWRSTGDSFFLWFALSFMLEAVNRVAMALSHAWNEDRPLHYIVRLVAFLFILCAVWQKNRSHHK